MPNRYPLTEHDDPGDLVLNIVVFVGALSVMFGVTWQYGWPNTLIVIGAWLVISAGVISRDRKNRRGE